MRKSCIPILLLSLAACTPAGRESGPEQGGGADSGRAPAHRKDRAAGYAIEGQQRADWGPGWRAAIVGGQILLDSPTSAGWYKVAASPREEEGRLVYAAPALTLTVRKGGCAIAAYRAEHPDGITLSWDGGVFEGCGGPRAAPAAIEGSRWELVAIGGEPAPDSRSPAATLVYGRNGSLGGTLACNDGGIRTRWTAVGGFVPGGPGFEQTAMGCDQPAAEAFGSRFWHGLVRAKAWRREGNRLFITLADGREAELRYLL